MKKPNCLIFVEKGLKGTENQCLALAKSLGASTQVRHPELRAPWRWIAPYFRSFKHLAYKNADALFSSPSPDIIIAAGRKSVLAGLEAKKRSQGNSLLIQILDPRISSKHFDLVIAPEHDRIKGNNVITITGALHSITPEFLATHSATQHYEDLNLLPEPRIAVLIGGSTTKSEFTDKDAKMLGDRLASLSKNEGASLMITTSRRTSASQTEILKETLNNTPHFFWDGTGDNPYFDFLSLASYIFVTNDSVSMAAEALGTQKPVYIANIGRQGQRIEEFHSILNKKNLTKPPRSTLQDGKPQAGNDMMRVTNEILKRLKDKKIHG